MIPTKSPAACRHDVVALGEVMLRLDPGEGRIRTARDFRVWEGGGEYNVARGLARCFGWRAAVATALVRNEVGALVEDLIRQGGVDPQLIRWIAHDGIGRSARNGLNFVERGFGLRGGLGCSDRGHTAVSQLQPGDFDWSQIFGADGVRWLHTGGIFAGLSDTTALVAREAIVSAREHGTLVSFDANFRPSLWATRGGRPAATAWNEQLAPFVDVLIAGRDDFARPAGESFADFAAAIARTCPHLRVIASTHRTVHSASRNDYSAQAWIDGTVWESTPLRDLPVLDRIGSGDAFAAGLIHGLTTSDDPRFALELGVAHAALVMTTPGDGTMATASEVEALARGAAAHTQR